MSKLIGAVGGNDPDNPNAIVSTSSLGVEFSCDAEFTLKPEKAIEFATLIMRAAQDRIAHERELAGEIKDPASLVKLAEVGGVVPSPISKQRLSRIRGRRR